MSRRMIRCSRGTVSVELCLVTPMLLFMFIGIFDIGFLLFQQMEVEAAADAGALYAFSKGAAGFNATNVGAAVTAAAYPTQTAISATPTPYTACGCPNGTSGLTPVVCGSTTTCSNPPTYAVVSAQVTPTPIFNWPGYPSTINSAVVVRLP